MKYFVKMEHQKEWDEVTKDQYIRAEKNAGFRSKNGPNEVATGSFAGNGVRGYTSSKGTCINEDDKVTGEDRRMLDYFYNEKGDITRWSSWEDRRDIIAKQYPELPQAIVNLSLAELALQTVINKITDHEDYDD